MSESSATPDINIGAPVPAQLRPSILPPFYTRHDQPNALLLEYLKGTRISRRKRARQCGFVVCSRTRFISASDTTFVIEPYKSDPSRNTPFPALFRLLSMLFLLGNETTRMVDVRSRNLKLEVKSAASVVPHLKIPLYSSPHFPPPFLLCHYFGFIMLSTQPSPRLLSHNPRHFCQDKRTSSSLCSSRLLQSSLRRKQYL